MSNLEILIDRWRAGDQRAAQAIYELHRDRTYRLAFGLLNDRQDAEEAAQDALAYALKHIDRFDEKRSKFTTWLHMITVSRSRDILRKRRPPTFSFGDWVFGIFKPIDLSPKPEEKLEKEEAQLSIWQAVQQLPPTLREAIILRHWEGHTYKEIGEIAGCPMKTAQSRVRLAHERLAKRIADNDRLAWIEESS